MTDFNNAVVLITGAAGGFGREMIRQFLADGINVSTVYPWFNKTAILDSEQFGRDEKLQVPDELVSDPADVVAQMLRGIRKNQQHVFPDKMARQIQFMRRHFPRLLDRLIRRLEDRVRKEQGNGERHKS